tara:strand:+ start:552 stop:809 length:258 start_codon:yes stop_codon:yes gene_type:complete
MLAISYGMQLIVRTIDWLEWSNTAPIALVCSITLLYTEPNFSFSESVAFIFNQLTTAVEGTPITVEFVEFVPGMEETWFSKANPS